MSIHPRSFSLAGRLRSILWAMLLLPIIAGVGQMHYPTFLTYNVIGGFIWAVLIPLAGYFLGSVIPDVDKYLLPIIGAIVVLSALPTLWEWRSTLKHAKQPKE